MFPPEILYDCVEFLLKQDTDEHTIDYLYKILIEFGHKMSKSNPSKMKLFFERIDKIASTNSELKSLLTFLITLKNNSWIRTQTTATNKIDKKNLTISKIDKTCIEQPKSILHKEVNNSIAYEIINSIFDLTNCNESIHSTLKNQCQPKLLLIFDPNSKQVINSKIHLEDDDLLKAKNLLISLHFN